MKHNLPKYICEYSDRHGKLRRYFRYKGKNTAVPYNPGHAEFDAYYQELLLNSHKAQGSTLALVGQKNIKQRNKCRGFIYFAKSGKFVKIGFAKNPVERIAEMQTGSYPSIEIIHAVWGFMRDERDLHKRFAALRVRGEWFSAAPELIRYIEDQQRRRLDTFP